MTISIWSLIAIWIILVINCALLFVLLMKKNPTIIINNNERDSLLKPGNIEMLDFKPSIVGNEKHWSPPDVLAEPLEPGNLFPKNVPTFKGKPLASGFGDPNHG